MLLPTSLKQSNAAHPPSPLHTHSPSSPQQDQPNYEFQFGVSDSNSGNEYGQQESRVGEDTRGSYRVLLPDGRVQVVKYYVSGDSGFVAEVTYEQPS